MSARLPIAAAAAVVLASLSLSSVLSGNGWLGGGIGAAIIVTAAGIASRLPGPRFTIAASTVVLIGVVPLLLWPGWRAQVVGLALVAATAASATGNRLLRGFAVLALYLAALLIYLNLVFATGLSYGHVIASHASINQLGRLIESAISQIQHAPPPLTDTSAVSLIGAAGIGLVSVMVDLLAVRMQRPAIAGLPLLALFIVPVASNVKTFGGLQVLAFAVGMAGYLTLLSDAGRERLRLWGQVVTFRYVQALEGGGSQPDTKQLAASGRRVGLAAVCLAVIITLVLPSLRPHDVLATTPSGGSSSHGGSTTTNNGIAQVDPFLQVQQQLRESKPVPVLTYTTSTTAPADQYFPVYVLNYNGRADTWLPQFGTASHRVSADGGLPYRPDGQLASTPVDTVITTVALNEDQGTSGGGFLPVPYPPVKLSTSTFGWVELKGSLMLFNSAGPLGGLRYTVASSEPDPTQAQIESALAGTPQSLTAEYGSYTGPDAARLAAIAHQHTLRATTELEAAVDLQAWFTSGSFRYSLKPNLPSSHWLLTFLTTDRRGYCQQFAWAFAILARLVGIPSRLAIGYTGGSPGPRGAWQVTTADAHAWPELFFPGEGWLRFEPTPRGGAGQGTATVPPYASGASGGLPVTKQGSSAGLGGSTGPGHAPGPPGLNHLNHLQPGGGGKPAAVGGSSLWLVTLIPVLVLLLLGSPAMVRRLTRRRRWLAVSGDAAVAEAAWRELTDDLRDYRLSRPPGETPRSMARRIGREARLDPPAIGALARIVAAAERAKYARIAGPGGGLAADSVTVRRALAASVPVRQRLRALLLPASTLAAAEHALQRAGDTLEASLPALRRQLRGIEPRPADYEAGWVTRWGARLPVDGTRALRAQRAQHRRPLQRQ
jgi:hypothetical protein